ncbi:hypothetical protein G5714_004339 [Onychostoma macrolepis]|uniref:Uncharacterized protein n=1 Tax=Onychostoma macrolepis TaxID=369639 RepID=A0A7J6D4F9_9TELE|nr:hypothetical protein G5714_004339 [Onychostoma macrolepis]
MTGNSGVSSMVAEDIIMAFIMAGGSGVANRTGQAATLANEVADEAALAGVDSGFHQKRLYPESSFVSMKSDASMDPPISFNSGLRICYLWLKNPDQFETKWAKSHRITFLSGEANGEDTLSVCSETIAEDFSQPAPQTDASTSMGFRRNVNKVETDSVRALYKRSLELDCTLKELDCELRSLKLKN